MLQELKKRLEGRTITSMRQMTIEEADHLGFYCRPVILGLDDGSVLFPMRDDEGNDGGAMWFAAEDTHLVIPVARS